MLIGSKLVGLLAGIKLCPKTVPAPSISLNAPSTVSEHVKPRPMPIPSNSDGSGLFFEA